MLLSENKFGNSVYKFSYICIQKKKKERIQLRVLYLLIENREEYRNFHLKKHEIKIIMLETMFNPLADAM